MGKALSSASLRRLLVLVALALGVYAAPKAYAGVQTNTIHPTATIQHDGRRVVVTGPISATAGEVVQLRVTLSQRATGATGEGRTRFIATGAAQTWEATVSANDGGRFQPGSATAVALAVTTVTSASTDAHQWLVNINLVD